MNSSGGEKLKRVLGISASSRVWGNCESAVKQVLISAREAGSSEEFLRLSDLHIEPCRGCFTCAVSGKACPIEDDLHLLAERSASSDALVLAAPVYFMGPPAVLVGAIDRLLTMAHSGHLVARARPAVTLIIMGNREWRGVARPFVNMAAALLGFSVVRSMSLTAQGPGEIIADTGVVDDLRVMGKALAEGGSLIRRDTGAACPTCGNDCFRIEPPLVVCPICGDSADLDSYIKQRRFVSTGGEVRWGLAWLARHIDSWIGPSVATFRQRRRQVLQGLQSLKQRYSLNGERGKADVQ